MTALENKQYGKATAHFTAMLGEQILTVLSLGEYQVAKSSGQCLTNNLPKLKPLKSSADKVSGWTISRGTGYGSKPRLDFHRLPKTGKGASGLPEFAKGRKLPHYHRRGSGGIGLHRPLQKKPSWKWWQFWKRF